MSKASDEKPTIYLFGGSNGAGKTTFARSYLTVGFELPPRFLNADEIARGLSPLAPETMGMKAGRLLLSEIAGCLAKRVTERRYQRSLRNFVYGYAPLADYWEVWNNYEKPAVLTASSLNCILPELKDLLLP